MYETRHISGDIAKQNSTFCQNLERKTYAMIDHQLLRLLPRREL
ncbi:hypothetical protein [Anaplasma bovis]